MIYTVTFNPSLDYIADVENFREGMVNRTSSERILPGGKGINVSLVLSHLGYENTALGFLAGFTGAQIEKLLTVQGIATDFIQVRAGCSRINVKLRSGRETEINGQGPEISSADIEKLYAKLDTLSDGDILVLAGSVPDVMPRTVYLDIMKRLKKKRLKIVVDATNELLRNVLPYQPFLIKPNLSELEELFHTRIEDTTEMIAYAKKLQKMGARNVLISLAGDGAVLLAESGEVYESGAPQGIVKNSVGAGDSMVAGFLAGYLLSGDYRKALQMGICTGSASAFSEELATRENVDALMISYCGWSMEGYK